MRPLSARDVAYLGLVGYFAGRSVVIPGFVTRLMVALLGIVPTRFVLPAVAAAQRRRRR